MRALKSREMQEKPLHQERRVFVHCGRIESRKNSKRHWIETERDKRRQAKTRNTTSNTERETERQMERQRATEAEQTQRRRRHDALRCAGEEEGEDDALQEREILYEEQTDHQRHLETSEPKTLNPKPQTLNPIEN